MINAQERDRWNAKPAPPARETAAAAGEGRSDALREVIARTEPRALRTYTPSLAVIARSEGCYHYTPEGRKLADFTSGVLVANLGHNPTRWWRRLLEYLGHDGQAATPQEYFAAAPLTSYNAITPVEALACQRLLESLRSQPGGGRMERVLWSASGSEGVIKALRAALAQDPRRQMILATRGGFHGKKGLAGAVTGSERDPERDERVRFISFPRDECSSIERRRQPIDLAPYADELERTRAELGDRICCLITEPYLGGGGSYHPQPQYLQLLEAFCRRHGVIFILDEVQSNFGRTGSMYAFTHYGVEPDVVVLGKGLGNGVPVDAAVGRAELFDKLNYGEASDTWSGHPLGCAAVLATLDEFEQANVLERGRALSRAIEAGLRKLTETPAVAAIRGEGFVWGVQCAPLGERKSSQVAADVVRACYLGDDRGRAIHLLGPLSGDVIRVAPPLVMPPDEAAAYLEAMHQIVARVSA
ncbi:MAG: aspartate aminotransferase family protein [Planctomycetota bacterium]|nr:MAG: aspartate aminotransferase family protein [Planctomycetota bacterium]